MMNKIQMSGIVDGSGTSVPVTSDQFQRFKSKKLAVSKTPTLMARPDNCALSRRKKLEDEKFISVININVKNSQNSKSKEETTEVINLEDFVDETNLFEIVELDSKNGNAKDQDTVLNNTESNYDET